MLIGTFRLTEVIPDHTAAKIRRYASVDRYGGVDIHDLEMSNWQDILHAIASGGAKRMASSPMVFESGDPDWSSPQADWVGAVLSPDYVDQSVNPASDCSPVLPGGCRGIVKPDLSLILSSRPEGHVAGIDDEVIFSRKMCNLLKGDLVERGAVVSCGGEELPWKRVLPTKTAAILSSDSFCAPMNCTVCGTLYIPTSGIWIAKNDELVQDDICVDELGHSHIGARHPFVVSLEFACRVEKLLGKGYALPPVYAPGSGKAQLVREFHSQIEKLFEMVGFVDS